MKRMVIFGIAAALMSWLGVSARAQIIDYSLAGNLRTEQGTIEMWFCLSAEPDPTQRESLHYFPIFLLQCAGEQHERARFSYATIWGPQAFHFFWSSSGWSAGQPSTNPYVTTVEDTQKSTKADQQLGKPYPRTPRLKAGEWHYLAMTWARGNDQVEYTLYLDGQVRILPVMLPAIWWGDLEQMKLRFTGAPYHDNIDLDEFRISDVVRPATEIAETFTKGALTADVHTLVLDHFDSVITDEGGQRWTSAQQISGFQGERGGKILNGCFMVVDGKFGKAIRLTAKTMN